MALNGNLRQIHRFAGQERDAPNRPGDIFLAPAATLSFHAWECDRADEAIALSIDPQHLQQLAAENDILHPERLELRPILQTRDPQIEAFATTFRAELCQPQLGSRLYSESLANQLLIHLLRHYCSQPLTLVPYSVGRRQSRELVLRDLHHSPITKD